MKIITIFYENKDPIIIEDEDNIDLDTYTKKLSDIFDVNKIVILKTTSGNHVLRPNKIVNISVKEKVEHVDSISD